MKMSLMVVLLQSLVALSGARGATVIDHSALDVDVSILGELGVSFGQVVEIEATIVSGDSLRMKGTAGHYLLEVSKVGEEAKESAPLCEFEFRAGTRPGEREIASDTFSLFEMKTGRTARSLSPAQVEKLERDYVGRSYRLLAYEVGEFSGIPNGMPCDYAVWQDEGFGFRTRLIVLRVMD